MEHTVEARLLRTAQTRETWADYLAAVAAEVPTSGTDLIEALDRAELRGRGGAGFPAARKWRTVMETGGPRAVVANGEEGEPFSYKDRYLLRRRPHLVLDGLLLAAQTVQADRAIVYLSDEASERSVLAAITERREAEHVEVFRVAHDYVAGEESALVRAIDGGPALPTEKPPRPFERGVGGIPTLVNNVETLAHAAWIARHPDVARLGMPTPVLATIGGACAFPGLYELDPSDRIGAALERAGADLGTARGVLMGGYFAGLVNRRVWSLPIDYDRAREQGTGIGCGAFLVLGSQHCAVQVAARGLRFFAGASARQCGACFNGTERMADACERLADGRATPEDVDGLERWSTTLIGRGACGLLDGAAQMAATLLREFPEDVARHVAGEACERCAGTDHSALFASLDEVPPVHLPIRDQRLDRPAGEFVT